MSAAVVMLSGDGVLPQPQKPGFYTERDMIDHLSEACSANEVSFTLPEG